MRSMAPKTSLNAAALSLIKCHKKSSKTLYSTFWAPFFRRSIREQDDGKKRIGFIGHNLYLPRVDSNESICPYISRQFTSRNDLLFYTIFFFLVFSTLSEALDKAKRKYQSKIKRLEQQAAVATTTSK